MIPSQRSIALVPILALGVWLQAMTVPASSDSSWLTRSWQTDEGLPNNYVNAIVQGDDGFLWVGTPDGLLRFDGVRFVPYPIEAASTDNGGLRALLRRHGGGLWMAPLRRPLVGLDAAMTPAGLPDELSNNSRVDGRNAVLPAALQAGCLKVSAQASTSDFPALPSTLDFRLPQLSRLSTLPSAQFWFNVGHGWKGG